MDFFKRFGVILLRTQIKRHFFFVFSSLFNYGFGVYHSHRIYCDAQRYSADEYGTTFAAATFQFDSGSISFQAPFRRPIANFRVLRREYQQNFTPHQRISHVY